MKDPMHSRCFVPRSKQLFLVFVLLIVARDTLADAPKDWAGDWARMKPIVSHSYVCYRAEHPPKIDGLLDDAAWQRVGSTEDFVDIEGARSLKPRLRTRAKMLWDAEYFYIAAELEEPHAWATLTKHDAVIFNDNDFEVFINPDGNNRAYYEFEINALNTSWDLFLPKPYKDRGRADNSWEIPGLKTAVHVIGTLNDPADKDTGWTVEIAIPWAALREFAHCPVPPRDGDQWRVDFSRVEWQHRVVAGKYQKVPHSREDNWVWSPIGIVDMHRPERWGLVQFSKAPAGHAHFQPDPTMRGRDALMEIYYAQQAFEQQHGHWAQNLTALNLDRSVWALHPQLTTKGDGFLASLEIPVGNNSQTWTIRQDSSIRRSSPDDDLSDKLEAILTQQAGAWNRGDIDAFMEDYWKSDQLAFSSGGHTTRGWQMTKDNYKRRYPTRERMGHLTFDGLEVTRLGDAAALMLGRWHLDRDPAPVGGNFSLIFRRIDGRWVIVHDHTSLRN
jgi:ketosteroid isomerase-like protein